jgi:hypothetical protein
MYCFLKICIPLPACLLHLIQKALTKHKGQRQELIAAVQDSDKRYSSLKGNFKPLSTVETVSIAVLAE